MSGALTQDRSRSFAPLTPQASVCGAPSHPKDETCPWGPRRACSAQDDNAMKRVQMAFAAQSRSRGGLLRFALDRGRR